MKTIDTIHRENLKALVEEFDSVAAVAAKIGCSSSQYSQWMNGSENSGTGKPRGLRPSSARRIEKACGKAQGWLDKDHSEESALAPAAEPDHPRNDADAIMRLLSIYHRADANGKGAIDDVADAIEARTQEARQQRKTG